MAVNIGDMHGVPQLLELRGERVYINDEPWPIKYVTSEEIEHFASELEAIPEGVDGGQALRDAKRIEFIVSLMKRTFGDESVEFLEHLLGHLHYRVLQYLGETDDVDIAEEDESAYPRLKGQSC